MAPTLDGRSLPPPLLLPALAAPWWEAWWFWVLAFGVLALLVGMARRRTRGIVARNTQLEYEALERRRAQEALAAGERQMRLIADALPVLIAHVDADGRCLFSNLASERWFRRPRTEVQGRVLEDILPPDVLAAAGPAIDRVLRGQHESLEYEIRSFKGETRRVAATLVPDRDGQGAVRGFYALAQDITGRVRSEEAVRRQHEQMAHHSRVLTLGELATAIAHELNQPLTAILGNAQAALRFVAADEAGNARETEAALHDIATDAARGGHIIKRLLDLARRGESNLGPLDLNGAIRGIEPLLRASALERDVRLTFELDPALGDLRGDVIQIQQVVLNLARNGMDALREVPRGERRVVVRTLHDKGFALTEVSDSGPQVDEAVKARLFEPFYTTKATGLGMGLAISRSIVEAHGGRMTVVGSPPGGLTVGFRIPLPTRGTDAP